MSGISPADGPPVRQLGDAELRCPDLSIRSGVPQGMTRSAPAKLNHGFCGAVIS